MNRINNTETDKKNSYKASSLLPTHTSRIQCDHCGLFHNGESHLSLESAYNQALQALEFCREHHKRQKQAMAYSNINQGVAFELAGAR